jgi:3-oxoacyl-[acyl-carrier protein] reductase
MDLGIAGKVALITGASAGLGEAVALGLASEGAKVAIAARRQAVCDEVAIRAVVAGAPVAKGYAFDQADAGSIAALLASVSADLGPIDIVVVNGGGPKPGRFDDVALADWDAAYALTLRSAVALVQGAVPSMRARGFGRVVVLASTSVKQPIGNIALSNAFRTGLVAAMKTLATDVAKDGVTVNVIATGRVATDRLRALYGGGADAFERAAVGVPAGRVATPEEFAPMAVFLCSAAASYVTGQTIAVDGGLVAGTFGLSSAPHDPSKRAARRLATRGDTPRRGARVADAPRAIGRRVGARARRGDG